jgi:hypothetical protein
MTMRHHIARHTRTAAVAVAAAASALIAGCAIVDLQNENRRTEGRIVTLQEDLAREEQVQASLAAQRDALLNDLKTRELTVADMRQRLEAIRKINQSASVATPQQRRVRDERERQLTDAANKAQVLERDTSLSQQEKAKRLADLKAKTQQMLQVLLQG